MPAEEVIRDGAVHQCAQQELGEVIDMGDGGEDGFVGALPDKRVGDDDRRRERGWAPIRREVDHGRWKVFSEQNVAGEVTVDELARGFDRSERCREPSHVFDVVERTRGQLAPRNPITDCPGVCAGIEEVGTRNVFERGVESLTDGDDLRPATPLVPAFDRRPRRPAGNDE